MSERWPALAKYFGLEGIGPVDDPNVLKPGEYIKKHQDVLEEHSNKSNKVFKAVFLDTYGYYLTSDRQLSLDKARRYINPLVEVFDTQDPTSGFQRNNTPLLQGVFDTDSSQSLTLLIDFKTCGPALWPEVLAQLEPLRSRNYLTYFNGTTLIPGPVTVVGIGNTLFDLLVFNTAHRDVFFETPLDELREIRELEEAPGMREGDEVSQREVLYSRERGARRRRKDVMHPYKPQLEDEGGVPKIVAADGTLKLHRSDKEQGESGNSKPVNPDIYTTITHQYHWANRLDECGETGFPPARRG
ncbi:MAG: Altered inheritance of mitochondria protein 6 [Pleopsidium flavum]|nr:MAG: Altered inheritance of mitochondria protein 6 [Pleopsidium flavum]